jgi:hypothetical protein
MAGLLPDQNEFHTWKEIAAYLRVSVRKAQEWEKADGLPVRRHSGTKPQVWAIKSELDAWKLRTAETGDHAGSPRPDAAASLNQPEDIRATMPNHRVSRWLVTLAGVIALAGLAVALALRPNSDRGPVRAEVKGSMLSAIDETGRTKWTRSFQRELAIRGTRGTRNPGRMVQVADILANGSRQVIFAARYDYDGSAPEASDILYCYSASGAELWHYQPDMHVTMGDQAFNGPWNITDILVVTGPGQPPKVWVTLAHWMWWPGMLVSIDPQGKAEMKFLNAGHLYAMSSASSGGVRYLLAGGINNEYSSAAVAVVREDAPVSCSPDTPHSPFECRNIHNEGPEKYFLFPPTEVNFADGAAYNRVEFIESSPEGIMVRVLEETDRSALPPKGAALYNLSPETFEAQRVAFDDSWASAHVRLERLGAITHTLELCPVLRGPAAIRQWNQKSGWTTVSVPLKNGIVPKAYRQAPR